MEELYINRLKILLLAFLVITISSCVGTAAVFHVPSGGSIQAAINNASSGDTIIVAPGNYIGNIAISRSNNLNNLVLMSESGDPTNTVITANNTAPATVYGVISISGYKSNVTVKGFTVNNARDSMAGIYLDQGRNCIIENNVFMNDGYGVRVNGGSGNTISGNTVNRTRAVTPETVGISVATSANTIISQNTVSNYYDGIRVTGSLSKGSKISGNSANKNVRYGIFFEGVKGATIEGNTLNSNDLMGINLASSSENYVTNNNIEMLGPLSSTGAFTQGIQLIYSGETSPVPSDSNIVANNNVNNAAHGIFSNGCKNNTIQNNRVSGCNYGLAMRYSHNNRLINNNVDGNTNGINGEGIFLTYQDSGNTISGNSANECKIGIHLNPNCGANNLVEKNIVNSNQFNGIYVEAPSNKISNNSLSGNGRGIFLTGQTCTNNTVSNNIVQESVGIVVPGDGIYLLNTSDNNKVVTNSLISNSRNGIDLYGSNNSYLDSNYLLGHANMGIQLENSNGVTVNNNTAYQNRIGIRVYYSSNNTLSKNNATYSGESGIDMNSATGNTVSGNLITWNDGHGITMCPACRNNLVYNNYFNNGVNTGIQNGQNTWFSAKTPGKNVVGGPYIGGNFWASPDGEGFSQTAHDMDGDGISDTAYIFTNPDGITIADTFPLVSVILPVADFSFTPTQGVAPLNVQFTDLSQNADSRIWDFGDGTNSTDVNPAHTYSTAGTFNVKLTVINKNDTVSKPATVTVQEYVAPPITPVANFNANPTSGYAPLTVQFTDNSQNAVGWSWNFGDGATSNEPSPSHTYSTEGTYTVSLTVNNANGTNSKDTTISVQSSSSGGSSHSSGGSGGGGAGGSPEPQNNVAIKELSQTFIATGQPAKFEFPQKATAVELITFDSKKTVGKTTTIVEMLKNQSTLVSGTPSNEVYKFLNIWVGNGGYATPKNIENAVVSFKVPKSWVQDNKIDKSSITLYRYSDKTWNALPTTLASEGDTDLKFTAQTPGFSPFAITGKSTATGNIQPSADKQQTPAVSETQNNTTSTPAKTEKTPEKESPSPSTKQSPGFEAVFVIVGLLAVFLYRRK